MRTQEIWGGGGAISANLGEMPPEGLSFDRADYRPARRADEGCAWCGRGLTDSFHMAEDARVCFVCAGKVAGVAAMDTKERFLRSAGAGAAVAIAGSTVCLALMLGFKSFGYGVGIASAGIGYAVGTAMRRYAPPVHGRRYQVTGSLLSYAAVVTATSVALLGLHDVPAWAYPLLLLTPIASLVFGHVQFGLLQLFLAGMAIRLVWMMLRPRKIILTGPHPVGSGDSASTI
jgi:hypothetical protein